MQKGEYGMWNMIRCVYKLIAFRLCFTNMIKNMSYMTNILQYFYIFKVIRWNKKWKIQNGFIFVIQYNLTSPEQHETLCESLFPTDSLVQIHRSLVELVSLKSELQRSQRFHTDRFCTLIKTRVGLEQQEPHNLRWNVAGQWLRQPFAAREIPAYFTVQPFSRCRRSPFKVSGHPCTAPHTFLNPAFHVWQINNQYCSLTHISFHFTGKWK